VFDWFRSTLHIDLLALAPPLQQERGSDGGDEIPPPTDGSEWWEALCARFRDGVLLGQISSALSGQPMQGVLLHPKNQAGVQHNWRSALAMLRVGGGLSPSARAPSRQLVSSPRSAAAAASADAVSTGDGIIPFTLLFAAEDLVHPNPALLWTLLAKIYEEYRFYTAKRNWSVEPVQPGQSEGRLADRACANVAKRRIIECVLTSQAQMLVSLRAWCYWHRFARRPPISRLRGA
jgi:hypothetical protein